MILFLNTPNIILCEDLLDKSTEFSNNVFFLTTPLKLWQLYFQKVFHAKQ